MSDGSPRTIQDNQTNTAYLRIAHEHSVKNGWQHSTTVSLTWTRGALGHVSADLNLLLLEADRLGRHESIRRTALDKQEGMEEV